MAKKLQRTGKKTGFPKKTKTAKKNLDLENIDDPELRQWATEVRRRQQELSDPKRKPVVASRIQDETQSRMIFRRKTDPVNIRSVLKIARRKSAIPRLNEEIKLVRESWERAVGETVASETRVFSFAKGILTIDVLSGSLMQEIRQFQKHAIFSALLDVWQASQPVVQIKYRLGKK